MTKVATVQARIDIKLKHQADIVLHKIGISPSQAINALFAQIVMQGGIPFELKIPKLPNAATEQAIRELEAGGGKSFSDFQSMIDDAENDDA